MSFPLSNFVEVGDPTEASQYNNLRKDALFLGSDPDASGNLLQLLYQKTGSIRLARTSGAVITLSASPDAPAAVMIGGVIHAVETDLTLSLAAEELQTAGRYGIYAVGSGSGFTLAAGTYGPADSRKIGSFMWSGSGIVPGTLKNEWQRETERAGKDLKAVHGRLTLYSGWAVPDVDITVAEQVYFTPYEGNEIGLYLGGEWELLPFTQLSMSLGGMQQELPYDLFIGADENGLYIEKSAWGSASERASTLFTVDGIQVNAMDPGLRYVGTIALNENGYGEDSKKGRLLWNRYNQTARPVLAQLGSVTAVDVVYNKWVPYFQDRAPEVRILVPGPEAEFDIEGTGCHSVISDEDAGYLRTCAVGIGLDMEKDDPYLGNKSCVPVFCRTFGNSQMTVRVLNSDSKFQGYHRYTLAFYTNYTIYPQGQQFQSSIGENAGLYGMIRA